MVLATDVGLPRRAAVDLAQALVDHVAAEAQIRVLALKGATLEHHGLRRPRTSSDADVLVAPGSGAELERLLARSGWQVRYERDVPAILPRHSTTLLHPRWPIDLDLHWYFPGLHADPEEAFETLWRHREAIVLAGREVTCLDLPASALVAAVHCARYPRSAPHQHELAQIEARLAAETDGAAAVAALARETRAVSVLRTLLRDLGQDPGPDDLSADERETWRRYTATHEWGSTGAWLQALSSGTVRQRLGTVGSALWPDRLELERSAVPGEVEAGGLSRRRRWRLRSHRWRRALGAIVPTLRALRRSR